MLDTYGFQCKCRLCSAAKEENNTTKSLKEAVARYLKQDPHLHDAILLKQTLDYWKAEMGVNNMDSCCSLEFFQTQVLMDEKPWNDDVMGRLIHQINKDMVEAEDNESLASCVERMQKVAEKFRFYYGPFHVEMHKIRGKLLTAYLMLGDQLLAYKVCSQIVCYLILSLLNMDNHPLLGVQLFTLGKKNMKQIANY